MRAPAKSPADTLRPRLLDRSFEAMLEALDRIAALPDEPLVALYDGVGAAPPSEGDLEGFPTLARSAYFTGRNGPEQAWLDHAMLRLAPRVADRVPAAKALCESTALHLAGGAQRPGVSLPVEFLASYPRLERVALSCMTPQRLDALAPLTKLRAVTLHACALDAAPELRACASIESLTLRRCPGALPHLGAWPTLRALTVEDEPMTIAEGAFEGLTGLAEITLTALLAVRLAALGLPASIERASLTRCALRDGIDGIERCTALRALDLSSTEARSLDALRSLRALTSLTLERCYAATNLAPLASLTALTALRLPHVPTRDITPLRGLPLESLDLTGTAVTDLSPLRGMTTLRALSASTNHGLDDLTPLADCAALESLSLTRNPLGYSGPPTSAQATTRDLAWMARLTRLREAALDMPALSDLRGIEGCAALTALTITRAAALTDLAALSRLTALTRLSITGADVARVDPVASLPALVALDLRSNRHLVDASPLWRVATLRRVALGETGVPRDSIPKERRHAVTWAREPDMERAFEAEEAPKPRLVLGPKGQGATIRKQFSALRAQLNAKDLGLIDQAGELLAALDDPTLFDELIAGATWTDGTSTSRPSGHGGFTPPPTLGATKRAGPYQTAAILAVISRAPAGATAARALRDGVRSLFLGSSKGWGSAGAVDFGPIGALPNLTRLWLSQPTEVRRPEGLRGHATLATLELSAVYVEVSLDLTGCAALRTLSLDSVRKLQRLDLSGCVGLRRVELRDIPKELVLAGARDLSGLRRVELSGMSSLAHLAQLAPLDRIEHLSIAGATITGLGGLVASCVSLRSFELRGGHEAFDVDALTRAPRLSRVSLRSCKGIKDLEALTKLKCLEVLEVQDVPAQVPEALRSVLKR